MDVLERHGMNRGEPAMNRIDYMEGNGTRAQDAMATRTPHVPEAGLGVLFRRMTDDVSLLARQEFLLAKAELRESAEQAKHAGVKFAIAAVLAIPGAITLTAFLVIVLANALNSWWAATLLMSVVLLVATGILVRQGIAGLSKENIGMPETAESLSRDAEWAKAEVKAFKRELTA
jgi:cation transport ATPase